MKIIAFILWGAVTFYFTLCVFLPEMRLWAPYRDKKVGLLTSVGMAMLFGLPMLTYAAIVTGLLHERNLFAVYLAVVLGVVVAIVGSWIDHVD